MTYWPQQFPRRFGGGEIQSTSFPKNLENGEPANDSQVLYK